MNWLKNKYKFLNQRFETRMKIFRYVLSGGTAAVVDLVLLYILTDILNVWYLFSTVMAFIAAFLVSFTLQKYWTFKDHSNHSVGAQGALYFTVSIINLAVNTAIVYSLTDVLGSHYMISQLIASGSIAIFSFFIYQKIIFVSKK